MKSSTFSLLTALLLISSCSNHKTDFDATGAFEAPETIISAEVSGVLKQFTIEEGQSLSAGQVIGYIDSVQLHLKKQQLESQEGAVLSKKPDISVQLASLESQLEAALKEQKRISSLVKADAATGKQLDDINAQVLVYRNQINALHSSLDISTRGINKDAIPIGAQIAQTQDQLDRCRIINPTNGTVLVKYAEPNEMVSPGKPLYKMADLSSIILRAYVTENQLSSIRLNQEVTVAADDGKGGLKSQKGHITWISDKAEFTPKTIQTKEERANLVYAIKVKVVNDGSYKIGMYGELKFQ